MAGIGWPWLWPWLAMAGHGVGWPDVDVPN